MTSKREVIIEQIMGFKSEIYLIISLGSVIITPFRFNFTKGETNLQRVVNQNIRRLADERGIRYSDLADKARISRPVMWNIVRCKRKVYADEVIPIAAAMGVGVEDLFAEE